MTGDADVLRNRPRMGAAAVSPPLIARVRELLEASRPDGDWTLDEVKAVLHRADPLIDEAESAELPSGVHAELVGLGAVAALLATPGVTDVLVNGPGPVWIERAGALERTSVVLDAGDVARLVERTLGPLGRRVDPALPIADAAMADGTRVAVVVPPVALGGPVLAYRRFEVRAVPLDRFASPRVEAALEAVIARRYNTVVFGGTGAGKTTLLDALCARLPPEAAGRRRDTHGGRHLVRLEARRANAEGSGSVELGDLVRTALRLRPDRLIVGEVRGGEAADLVTALSTGHDGGLSTVHAGSPAEALDRLESMTLLGHRLGVAGIRRRLHAAIDVLVGVARRGDGADRSPALARGRVGESPSSGPHPGVEIGRSADERRSGTVGDGGAGGGGSGDGRGPGHRSPERSSTHAPWRDRRAGIGQRQAAGAQARGRGRRVDDEQGRWASWRRLAAQLRSGGIAARVACRRHDRPSRWARPAAMGTLLRQGGQSATPEGIRGRRSANNCWWRRCAKPPTTGRAADTLDGVAGTVRHTTSAPNSLPKRPRPLLRLGARRPPAAVSGARLDGRPSAAWRVGLAGRRHGTVGCARLRTGGCRMDQAHPVLGVPLDRAPMSPAVALATLWGAWALWHVGAGRAPDHRRSPALIARQRSLRRWVIAAVVALAVHPMLAIGVGVWWTRRHLAERRRRSNEQAARFADVPGGRPVRRRTVAGLTVRSALLGVADVAQALARPTQPSKPGTVNRVGGPRRLAQLRPSVGTTRGGAQRPNGPDLVVAVRPVRRSAASWPVDDPRSKSGGSRCDCWGRWCCASSRH
jgi:pilus assembly protein CpaF